MSPAAGVLRRLGPECVVLVALIWGASGSALHAQAVQTTAFDLPSEPLAIALERLMAATSLAIVVDSGLTDGLRSSSLKGVFTPEQALRRMLVGTGLEARAVGAGLFTLVHLPPGATARPLPRFIDFAAAVQDAVTNALCQRHDTRPTYYRTVLRLWFDPAGVVVRVHLGYSTGNSKLDMTVTRSLQRLEVGMRPPSGLPQPVKLAILPHATESAACPGLLADAPPSPGMGTVLEAPRPVVPGGAR